MNTISQSPAFGIVLSLVMYMIALWIRKRLNFAIFNPLLVAIILVIGFLLIFDIPYENYNKGGQYITFLVGPATLSLVIKLYKRLDLLKENLLAIFIGVLAGVITSFISGYLLSKLFGLNEIIKISLIPRSLTTAIGIALSEEYGGLEAITIVAILITGIGGSVMAPLVMKVFRIKDPLAKGIGIGTSSHAVGTSKAIEMGQIEGAMSGLSIALAGFISVIIIPIIISILI